MAIFRGAGPGDVTRRQAGRQRPLQLSGQAGVTRVLPVGVPVGLVLQQQAQPQRFAGRDPVRCMHSSGCTCPSDLVRCLPPRWQATELLTGNWALAPWYCAGSYREKSVSCAHAVRASGVGGVVVGSRAGQPHGAKRQRRCARSRWRTPAQGIAGADQPLTLKQAALTLMAHSDRR